MIHALINHYTNGNKAQFASLLGVKPQTVNSWITRNTFDMELVYAKCLHVSSGWLLSGEGEMVIKSPIEESKQDLAQQSNSFQGSIQPLMELIRLKDEKILEQAEEIGRLRERINQLEQEHRGAASDAHDGAVANVG